MSYRKIGLISGTPVSQENFQKEKARLTEVVSEDILEFLIKNCDEICLVEVNDEEINEGNKGIRYGIYRDYIEKDLPEDIFNNNAKEFIFRDFIDYLKTKNGKYIYTKVNKVNESEPLKTTVLVCDI